MNIRNIVHAKIAYHVKKPIIAVIPDNEIFWFINQRDMCGVISEATQGRVAEMAESTGFENQIG